MRQLTPICYEHHLTDEIPLGATLYIAVPTNSDTSFEFCERALRKVPRQELRRYATVPGYNIFSGVAKKLRGNNGYEIDYSESWVYTMTPWALGKHLPSVAAMFKDKGIDPYKVG